MESSRQKSSFRDPAGFLFQQEGVLYRQINLGYQEHYDHLIASGLYEQLVVDQQLIPHQEVPIVFEESKRAYKVIQPQILPFISYPYEWCFGQLQQAALLTLAIQKKAFACGMTLKDASAFNVQWLHHQPIFIDTLSFEKYKEGTPWLAYRQFCQHFLAPLVLMSYTDIRANQFWRSFLDGIPLEFASQLLPWKTWGRLGILLHLHLHAKSTRHFSEYTPDFSRKPISKWNFLGLLDHLERIIIRLRGRFLKTVWFHYYEHHLYAPEAFQHKQVVLNGILEELRPKMVWDLGANDGKFSRLSAKQNIVTVAFELDPYVTEKSFTEMQQKQETHLFPLVMDLSNPSPNLGWGHEERDSLEKRGPADLVLALALIHHLAIAQNIPFVRIADYLQKMAIHLLIEFVPKNDPQVERLLKSRFDIFEDYSLEIFEASFSLFFEIVQKIPIQHSSRTLYFMRRKC